MNRPFVYNRNLKARKMTFVAKLALEDGTVFTGTAFGADGEVDGEVCFNTSMTGYQEILTDPSYRGQIVSDDLSGDRQLRRQRRGRRKPQAASGRVHRPRAQPPGKQLPRGGELGRISARHGIVGMEGIDTRALVRRIRIGGAMKGVLSTVDLDDASLVAKAKASPGLVGRDLVREVIPSEPRVWDQKCTNWRGTISAETCNHGRTAPQMRRAGRPTADSARRRPRLRHEMEHRPASVRHGLPRDDPARHRHGRRNSGHQPDGVFLSNGPGDPEPLDYAIDAIRGVLGKVPIFGICLGHQLLSLACGAKTFKLKFGHRGANQPVMNLDTGRVEITTQNHGFAVAEDSLPAESGSDAPQPERRHDRRPAPPNAAGLLRAISPRSLRRPARQRLSVPAISRFDAGLSKLIVVGIIRVAASLRDAKQIRQFLSRRVRRAVVVVNCCKSKSNHDGTKDTTSE